MKPLWDAAFKNTEAKNKGAFGGPLALPPAPYACDMQTLPAVSQVALGRFQIQTAPFQSSSLGSLREDQAEVTTEPAPLPAELLGSQQCSQAQWRSWLKLLRHRPWKVSAAAVWPGQRQAAWLQLDKSLRNAQQGRRQQQAVWETHCCHIPSTPCPWERSRGDSLGGFVWGFFPPSGLKDIIMLQSTPATDIQSRVKGTLSPAELWFP